MPENCPCRLSVGFFLAAAVENRLLQLLDPVEPSLRIGQQPVSAMQQPLPLAADAQILHVKAVRLVVAHPLLLIGCVKHIQTFDRRVIIGAERLRSFLIAGQIRRSCADAEIGLHAQKIAERPQGAEQVAVFGVIRIHGQPRGAVRITSRVARLHAVVELAHERVAVEQILFRVIDRLSRIVLRPG